jgi:hypothetical protein
MMSESIMIGTESSILTQLSKRMRKIRFFFFRLSKEPRFLKLRNFSRTEDAAKSLATAQDLTPTLA